MRRAVSQGLAPFAVIRANISLPMLDRTAIKIFDGDKKLGRLIIYIAT